MTSPEELLPCPFCGGAAAHGLWAEGRMSVRCMGCDCEGPLCAKPVPEVCINIRPWIDEAYRNWNRRAMVQAGSPVDGGWRPIETAPRDGTRIGLAFGSDASTAGWYEDDDNDSYPWKILDRGLMDDQFRSRNGLNAARDDKYGPTHWRPLPLSPASGEPG